MDSGEARKIRAMLEAFDEIEGHAHLLELKLKYRELTSPEAASITLKDVIVLLANIDQARKKFKAAAMELRRYERSQLDLFNERDEEDNGRPVRVYRRKRAY
jgi:hypothetical protein